MAKHHRKFTECPNCGYPLKEENNFCPNCGQENHDLNVPLKHLLLEFFEGTMHFDSKTFKTLKYLITRPGYLTERFNIGHRVSYVPPFRLYVFVSLIFFFVLALTTKSPVQLESTDKNGKATPVLPGVTINSRVADSLSLAADSAQLAQLEKQQAQAELDKLKAEMSSNERFAVVGEKFEKFARNSEESKHKLFKNLSFMMFLLMPFFAWLLYLFYRKRGRNYVEHLMFSIHLHTFYFILLIVAMLLGKLFPTINFGGFVVAIIVLYLFLALHRVYKQTYFRTFFKLIPISITYLLTLFIFLMGTVAISIMMA